MDDWYVPTSRELETMSAELLNRLPCRNPTCRELVIASGRRGPLSRFCSSNCRAEVSRERQKLLDAWAALDRAYSAAVPPLPLARLDQIRARLIWLLERYLGPGDVKANPDVRARELHEPRPPLAMFWDEELEGPRRGDAEVRRAWKSTIAEFNRRFKDGDKIDHRPRRFARRQH
ncbi:MULTISPECIES: hypothetical protein [Aeromicrobium]|uniref:hypothetical protein n=1 Tax=Aeromicrobium TaxID=2040 RepID=UPI00257A152D|nr:MULTISPECIES: hypothetical protein [Aeromicrobium]